MTQTFTTTWRGIALHITFTPDAFSLADHIEIRTENRQPIPVTETGYRSHFRQPGTVEAMGGAVALIIEWLEAKAKRLSWCGAQLSLF